MTNTAAPDTKRLRELANMATSGPWVWDVATYWDDSAHADAWSTDMEGHPLYESLEGPTHEVLGATYSGNIEAYPDDAAYIAALNPSVVLSLLDRIEELERGMRLAKSWMGPSSCGYCREVGIMLEKLT